jgi:hypothetical protein
MAKRPNAERQAWGQRRYRNGIEKVCFARQKLPLAGSRSNFRITPESRLNSENTACPKERINNIKWRYFGVSRTIV